MNHIDNDIKIEIENITDDEGHWILNRYQNVPAIIRWTCPVCGNENVRDCRYESFESPPLGSNFIISLICDNVNCQYVRAVELKINMILTLQNVLPQTIDELEIYKKYYEQTRPGNGIKQLNRHLRKMFLKNNPHNNIIKRI